MEWGADSARPLCRSSRRGESRASRRIEAASQCGDGMVRGARAAMPTSRFNYTQYLLCLMKISKGQITFSNGVFGTISGEKIIIFRQNFP